MIHLMLLSMVHRSCLKAKILTVLLHLTLPLKHVTRVCEYTMRMCVLAWRVSVIGADTYR
jgi:hypothetical protein